MGSIYDRLHEAIAAPRLVALTSVVTPGPLLGAKALVEADGTWDGRLPESAEAQVAADAVALMDREGRETLTYESAAGDVDVFIEVYAPPPTLLVFGAVHVAQPLVRYASDMGYRCVVADSRALFATQERFPEAERVLVGWPGDVLPGLDFDRHTFVVILSHDQRLEDPVLEVALRSPAHYIGAMGSRRTHAKRLERLGAAGFDEAALARIHGPVGLDIGAETPEETAISILAEMTRARYAAGTGHSLVGRPGRVHLQRTADAGDV